MVVEGPRRRLTDVLMVVVLTLQLSPLSAADLKEPIVVLLTRRHFRACNTCKKSSNV